MSTTLLAPQPLSMPEPPPPPPPFFCQSHLHTQPDHGYNMDSCEARQVISDSKLKTTTAAASASDKRSITITITSDADPDPNPNADADAEPLAETMRRLELASAKIHNFRLAARNARNLHGKLELLEKTIPGTGLDLAHALTHAPAPAVHDVPTKPTTKIRDRPKGFAHISHIGEFTGQDILDLVVFYNDDFGIVVQDDEAARREKLLGFLTGGGEKGFEEGQTLRSKILDLFTA